MVEIVEKLKSDSHMRYSAVHPDLCIRINDHSRLSELDHLHVLFGRSHFCTAKILRAPKTYLFSAEFMFLRRTRSGWISPISGNFRGSTSPLKKTRRWLRASIDLTEFTYGT